MSKAAVFRAVSKTFNAGCVQRGPFGPRHGVLWVSFANMTCGGERARPWGPGVSMMEPIAMEPIVMEPIAMEPSS